jgi:hypothetical protein
MHRLTPRPGELLAIAIFAFALRAVIAILALRIGHISLAQYTSKADTTSYIANAAVMCGERSFASLDDYDFRVFPGYPALIAIAHRIGFSLPLSAVLVTWLSAALAAVFAAKAFEDVRIGWAMTCLIPHYLINSSLGMSEAPLLMATCAAVLAWRKDRFVLAGILFAFAGMIRPMACFAFAGVLLAMIMDHRIPTPSPGTAGEGDFECRALSSLKRTLTLTLTLSRSTGREDRRLAFDGIIQFSLATVCAFAVEILLYQWWTGDALRGLHVYANHPGAYNGHLLGWPFQSLLTTPGVDHASLGRMIYIWAHVAITLGICVRSIFAVFEQRQDDNSLIAGGGSPGLRAVAIEDRGFRPRLSKISRDWVALPWVIGNTAFVLCIGSVWGFRHFPRFTIPAAPAMFWTVRGLLPRSWEWWTLIGIACAAMAVAGTLSSP